jgi:hypothetical protein
MFSQHQPLHCNPNASAYPMNPFRRMVTVGPQRQIVRLKLETDRARRNCETAMAGRCVTRRMVLPPGAEQAATGMSLMALTDRVHSNGANPPEWNFFLLMEPLPLRRHSLSSSDSQCCTYAMPWGHLICSSIHT